ncbi:MAG: DUF3990 domain-containing protein [Solobacterium sp.]|nr:DUF3990 domain-containing protein [Solobacterium sp.]
METLRLYHTGFQVIEKPDLLAGRKNADFGQGFYLSNNEEFSRRWARQHKGMTTYLNTYELDPEGLRIKRFVRDAEWFEYIFANRADRPDQLTDYDVIMGPIANDTIYDTWGILTSGWLSSEQALRVLKKGNPYEQIVIKSEKALAALRFTGADPLSPEEIAGYRQTVHAEEEQFQKELAELLAAIDEPEQ